MNRRQSTAEWGVTGAKVSRWPSYGYKPVGTARGSEDFNNDYYLWTRAEYHIDVENRAFWRRLFAIGDTHTQKTKFDGV